MSARVGKGLIRVRSPRGIEWYRPRSVRMPVASSSQQFHRQKEHMHLMRPHCVLMPATLSLRPVRPVRPEFSSSVRKLPMRPVSVPNARTPLLRPELRSNTPLHPDLTSPLFCISQRPDAFNSPPPSGSRQDYHTPNPSLLA